MVLGKYKKRIKAYINRDNFDYARYIDPWEYHSSFITWVSLFGVMDCENTKVWMYISPITSAISAIFGGLITMTTIVYYIQIPELSIVTEHSNYVMVLGYQIFILITIFRGKKEYRNLLQALKDDFHYTSEPLKQKYREKFIENQRLTFKACIVVAVIEIFIGCSMDTFVCTAVAITANGQEQGKKRPLPFQFWLFDYDLHESPLYEAIFAISMVFPVFFCYTYAFMMQSHIIWIRESTCRADFVTWSLQDLLVDVLPARNNEEKEHYAELIKKRMKEIIEMHLSMYQLINEYAAVYKKCLFFEQVVASPTICMTAYCFIEKYEAGEIHLMLLMQCIASIIMVFIPNYLCTHLLEKVQFISDACYNIPFWNAGPVIRPYLILIMQRSMRPLPFQAPGFGEISLQTYSTIMTRAYTGFNMLRQLDFDFTK